MVIPKCFRPVSNVIRESVTRNRQDYPRSSTFTRAYNRSSSCVRCVFLLSMLFLILERGDARIPDSAASLSIQEKIGQLFVIPAGELLGESHLRDVTRLILEDKVGGVLLKQGTIEGQSDFIARLQKISEIPLLCLQDAEWGVAMRLSDAPAFPKNLTLGAIQDLSLLYQLGQEIGRQCRFVSAQINLAPVIDVNSNPLNPIIHMRSFGEDPFEVARRAEKLSQGIQSMGILTCAKHFPGHGDVTVDSHVALPRVSHTKEEWEKVDLVPFQALIKSGVNAILSAHLCVEALEEVPCMPTTFSKGVIHHLLRKILKFEGLVISDALNMQALTNEYSSEEIAVGALKAGHDLLLYGDHIAPNIDHILQIDVPLALKALERAVVMGEISEAELSEHVDRILTVKREIEKAAEKDAADLVYSCRVYDLKKRLFEDAITVIRNEGVLPIQDFHFALIEWGDSPQFVSTLEKVCFIDKLSIEDPDLEEKLPLYPFVVLSLAGHSQFDHSSEKKHLLEILSKSSVPVVAVILGTPYVISGLPLFSAFVVAYENDVEAQRAAAHVLLGTQSPRGRLPISIAPHFQIGEGLSW